MTLPLTAGARPGTEGGHVRVMVADVWDEVHFPLDPGMTFATLKARALHEARVSRPASGYVIKLFGSEILDETQTLGAAKVPANAPLIVLPARRQPVR